MVWDKIGGNRSLACFLLIYRRITRYLDTDDDSSIPKRESATRLKPWELQPLSAIIPSDFSYSPFFEQPCLTAWLRPGCQNTCIIRYAEAAHGADWPWIDFLPVERPTFCVGPS